ncbi:MAG: extracellular solute-binding protein [Candidatus Limnocylindrales bacterium]|jgi:multiple sugar transport system substrate-binding protein
MATGIRYRFVGLAIVALMVFAACSSSSPSSGGQGSAGGTITLHALFMKQAGYSDQEVAAMTSAFEAANPDIKVQTEFVAYEALHDKIVTDQVGGSGIYDTVLMDTIWPAEFAHAGIVQDLTSKLPADFTSGVFQSAFAGGEYQGHFYGVPWLNDTEFLFYNKTMLAQAGFTNPPTTWAELVTQAQALKSKGIVQYPFVGQWAQSELGVCDWTTIAGGSGGASFFDAQGKPTFNQGGPLAALQLMVQMKNDGLANPASLGYGSDDVRNVLIAGQAAFGLDWTYVYAAANDPAQSKVVGQIGIAPAPGGGTNGGMSMAVTRSSKHADAALKYDVFLASQAQEEKYTENALPEWKASFDKPELAKGSPELWAAAKIAFNTMVSRPMVPYYTSLSNALQVAIQKALTGESTPQAALDDVAAQVPTLANQ